MITIIGIDPGVTGAVASVSDIGVVCVSDFTTIDIGKSRSRNVLNARSLHRDLLDILDHAGGQVHTHCLIERQSPRPQEGVSSSFTAGLNYGVIRATVEILEIPHTYVTPQQWKKHHKLQGSEKEASRARALELFPRLADKLDRKKHHGRAEALLIAEYGMRELA